ncbi:MAG TPA: radical SAM protein [Dissulfurispiraceae bacterium]|nr:radical SAM protein [Dissulfurispiraceae bacterium]
MYSPARHIGQIFRKTRPIHLTFFLTRRCNANCPFCFYLRGRRRSTDYSAAELTFGEIEKISRSMGSLLWLAFSGGEIYLRDDLVEISNVFYNNNRPAIMLYPTNGLLPYVIRSKTEQILKFCKKSIIAVKLSVDGLDGAHDALRNTPGSFEKTMETYRVLAELVDAYPNFELGVNTVFCSGNQHAMDGIIDFVKELNQIRTHTISLVRGDLVNGQYKDVDLELYNRAIGRLESDMKSGCSRRYRFRGGRIKAAQDIVQRRLIHRTLQEQRRLISCYAGRLNLVITECGDVFPCEILGETFGNVRFYDCDVKKLLCTDKAAGVVSAITDGKCYCTHECYFMTNILFAPALYPSVAREYLALTNF